MANWLLKTEPKTYSIDDLRRDGVTSWDGVRNYQARNYLRSMKIGDLALIYHSNSNPSGIVGLGRITKLAYPDPTQFNPNSYYYDKASSKDNPRWFCPDVRFERKFPKMLELSTLRAVSDLRGMELLRRGSRLSVQPVSEKEFEAIMGLI